MPDLLGQFFGLLCGQEPGHTWAPGGILLPCCQRCTGLYVGAFVAALAHICFRPKLTGRFLEIHGLFLLLMVPFGFHWLPQGPALRGATGVLYGSAVATFLWLPLGLRTRRAGVGGGFERKCEIRNPKTEGSAKSEIRNSLAFYSSMLALPLVLLPSFGRWDSALVAHVLSAVPLAGATVLGVFIVGNVGLAFVGTARMLWRRTRRETQL